MATTDSVVDNATLYVARDELMKSIADGQKALVIVNAAIAELEGDDETRSD